MLSHRKILVSGIVQGVGFRPFCARLAERLGLAGSVRNTSGGVEIELTGEPEILDSFFQSLSAENPPASVITSAVVLENQPASDPGEKTFRILGSKKEEDQSVLIPPDLAVCDDCTAEMRDPSDRRYRYPLHQLHELWSEVHNHTGPSLRQAENGHGPFSHVPFLQPGIS